MMMRTEARAMLVETDEAETFKLVASQPAKYIESNNSFQNDRSRR